MTKKLHISLFLSLILIISGFIYISPQNIVSSATPGNIVIGTSTSGHTSKEVDYLCDGANDDVEINAAIQNLPEGGGKITILEGTYDIKFSIKLDKDNITIEGMGNGTVLKNDYDDDDIIYINSSHNTVRKLYLVHYVLGSMNIYVDKDYNTITENKIVTSNYGNGIVADKSNYITISKNDVTGYDAIYARVNNSTITSNIGNNSTYGIGISGQGNTVSGNICNNNIRNGIQVGGKNNTVTGNTCNNNSQGIEILDAHNNTISGNTCNNNSSGIYLSSSSNNGITGNTIMRGTGLSTDYTSSQCTIQLIGTDNNNNFISNNLILGKNYTTGGGTGNTFLNNKYN